MVNKSSGIYNIIDEKGIKESITRVVSSGVNFNTYTSPKGLRELREEISKFFASCWNYSIDYTNMLITSGSQQSINLITYALLKEGDCVLIEQPTYFGAIECFKKRNINLVGVELQENGFDLNDLENKIEKYKPKLIYVTPTFNNPTGYAWDNEYRVAFLELINKYNLLVVEDDPYSLINFTNYQYKTLYQLNEGKNIIYLGTFSKYISPSINVGYVLASSESMSTLYSFKESFDLCTSLFSQYIILDYLQNNDLQNVVKAKVSTYRELLNEQVSRLKQKYGDNMLSFTSSKGGLFFSVKFRKDLPNLEFSNANKFYITNEHNNETRINICAV